MQMAHDGWCTLYDKAQSAAPLPVGAAINSLRTDRLNCMAGHIHALEMGRCWSLIWVSKAGRRCTHSSCPPPCPIVMRPTHQTKELKQAVILELLYASQRTVEGGFSVCCLAGGCLLQKRPWAVCQVNKSRVRKVASKKGYIRFADTHTKLFAESRHARAPTPVRTPHLHTEPTRPALCAYPSYKLERQ